MASSIDSKSLNYYVYFVLLLHGVGTLLPWNMFITANDYFVNKLNVTMSGSNETTSVYTENFLSYVGVASKLPNVAIQALNFIIASSGETFKVRILASIAIEAVIFTVTAAFVLVDMSSSPGAFFYFTMISIIAINIANGVFQNCIYGVVARFPRRYMNSLTTGMNASGVVSTLILIISMLSMPDLKTSSFVYFMIAVVFLAVCFVTYILLLQNAFFISHARNTRDRENNSVSTSETQFADSNKSYTEDYCTEETLTKKKLTLAEIVYVFKKCSIQLFNSFAVYAITLLVFPAVLANVTSTDALMGRFFMVICCFLNFNTFAMIGNLLADYLPLMNKKYLIIPVVARVVFIPFFLFCNYNANTRSTDVYFNSDFVFILGVTILATSCGYLGSLSIIFAPRCVESKYASAAGMMASFSIMIGIMTGISASLLMPKLV